MNAAREIAAVRGRLRENEPLARHTAWAIGGPARRFFEPADVDDLAAFLATLPEDEPLLWLGLGSNVLVRDAGFAGTVIHPTPGLGAIERRGDTGVRAEAGAPCAKIARVAARAGLVGGEFLAGIPGTMGGALAMNAGAWGGETWERVVRVATVDRRGAIRARDAAEYAVGYRSVEGPAGEWFVAAELALEPGDGARSEALIRDLLARRAASQPTGVRSCGSVFRNPPGDFAARLIEASGLKGRREGGAVVSEKHANFIVNDRGASAADVERLIETIARTVLSEHGVRLEPEVRVVGGEARS